MSQIIIFVGAVTFALWGLFCSGVMRTTLGASVMTFAGALFITIGLPMMAGMFGAILSPLFVGFSSLSRTLEILFQYGLILLAATNLPATLIVTDIFLIEEGTLFFFRSSPGASGVWLPSPWMIFVVLYLLGALILYWLSVRSVRKIANQ